MTSTSIMLRAPRCVVLVPWERSAFTRMPRQSNVVAQRIYRLTRRARNDTLGAALYPAFPGRREEHRDDCTL
jgi:hypothetical protein